MEHVAGSASPSSPLWHSVPDPKPELTTLLPSEKDALPARYRLGVIGSRDRTLEPMIRTGSILLIDTRKRRIPDRKQWTHELDRPILFFITRFGYAVGYCELDPRSSQL